MKKGAKIALCVLVVAVAAGGAAAAWQWNNIGHFTTQKAT